MIKLINGLWLSVILCSVCFGANNPNGAILLYHHVSNTTPTSTSISPEKFRQHMAYLHEHHNVVSLPDLVQATAGNTTLPAKAVAITFDDGYKNIYDNAHPILQEFDFPYTIFINPGQIGQRRDQLTWAQVTELSSEKVHFANHTLDHDHLLQTNPNETTKEWLARRKHQILEAEKQLTERLGYSLQYLAYPYGEFNRQLANMISDIGFVGFGQHSGAIGPSSPFNTLPRFPAAGIYSNLSTLKTKLNSLPMPLLAAEFADYTVQGDTASTSVRLDTQDLRISQLACYHNGQPLTIGTSDVNQVTFSIPIIAGRTRVNCTAPSRTQSGRYYWYSQPFFKIGPQGRWLD
jgi:peptidoglycan/xylan/chitin deacetylase (PgdA/CDA1 family)